MMGRDGQDPLFMQAKEAEASVLEQYVGESEFGNHGERVVEGQWLMQAASDILLGWLPARGIDGRERDFYVRQLWDGKRSVDVEALPPEGLEIYGRVCGWTLARAHARSGDRIAISTSARARGSIRRSPSSRSDTRIRMNSTTAIWLTRPDRAGSRPRPTSCSARACSRDALHHSANGSRDPAGVGGDLTASAIAAPSLPVSDQSCPMRSYLPR
jgi:hypothetical protein